MRISALTVGLVLAAFTISGPVFADERPPRYDLDGLCDRLALTPDGFSPESKAACVSAQADALQTVRRVWPNLPAYIQDNCDIQAKADRVGDYLILEACIRAQSRVQDANQGGLPVPKTKAKPATTPK